MDETMQQETPSENDRRDLRVLWALLSLAAVGLLICAIAGLILVIGDPVAESTSDDMLRAVTAASGLAVGVLAGAAAIYAQVKNLWRFAPSWFRYSTWAVLAAFVLAGVVGRAVGG